MSRFAKFIDTNGDEHLIAYDTELERVGGGGVVAACRAHPTQVVITPKVCGGLQAMRDEREFKRFLKTGVK